MKNIFLIASLSATLLACAGMSPVSAQELPVPKPIEPAVSPAVGAAVPNGQLVSAANKKMVDPLPDVSLTPDILYKLLSADIAYQRGYWKTGYRTMMNVARQTRDPRIARHAAEMAVSAHNMAEALAAVRLWRELAPHSDEANQYFLGFILLSDDLSEARPIFQQRLKEIRPQARGILMFQIQRLLTSTKNKVQAFALLEQLLAPYLSMPEAHVALAQGAFSKGDHARATQEAQRALALKPDSELAVLTLAQASGDPDQAEKVLAEFIAAHPQVRDVRVAYARVLVAQKKYQQARLEFEALLELQPQDLTALYSLGILSAQMHDPKNAEKYLTAYLEVLGAQQHMERDPAQVMLLLAQLADERGDAGTALKWLDQVEQLPGKGAAFVSARIKRAQMAARRGDIGHARKILIDTDVADESGQVQLILAQGQILRDAHQPREALKVLAAGLKQFPNDPNLLYDYAMAAEKLDKLPEMEAALRSIIALEPDNYLAYNALGYSLADRNLRLQEAYELIAHALKLAPNEAFILDSMGWVQFRLGKLDGAEKMLRRAFVQRPDAEIAAHLGEVLWFKGKKDEARKLWHDAAIKEPNNEALENTLKRLNVKL